MKRYQAGFGLMAAALLVVGNSALAQQFSGYFAGYYAPLSWTSYLSGNSSYQNTASVSPVNGSQSMQIVGAVDALTQVSAPQLPISVIDYYILLPGTGLQPVAFGYLFTGATDGYDKAQLIYYNGSGVQVTASLSGVIGVHETYSGTALGGQTIDFRVYSNNDNVADILTICAVPEPSTLTLLGLGLGTLCWKLRRRLS